MRMHQDIRPFPCTVCEQTFRQKAHLQRHEATHGIDSMANRKRRKRPLMDIDENELDLIDTKEGGGDLIEAEEEEEDIYRPFVEKRKYDPTTAAMMKTEREEEEETELDPMIEPIVQPASGGPDADKKLLCPVNVGTNTEELARHHVVTDEIEERTLEPVRFRAAPPRLTQVEQGVQYCEEDLLPEEQQPYHHHQHTTLEVKYANAACGGTLNNSGCDTGRLVGIIDTGRSLRDKGHQLKCERNEEEGGGGGVDVCDMDESVGATEVSDDGGEVTYSSQEHYVTTVQDADNQLIAQTTDGNYIDASGNQLVMSHDGELVGFVPIDNSGQSQVVNISTSTNEHGQQVVIIENLHNHSPELQQEILRALMSDTNLIPISHT